MQIKANTCIYIDILWVQSLRKEHKRLKKTSPERRGLFQTEIHIEFYKKTKFNFIKMMGTRPAQSGNNNKILKY